MQARLQRKDAAAGYRLVITRYQEQLARIPMRSRDQVMYQLARSPRAGWRAGGCIANSDRSGQTAPEHQQPRRVQFRQGELAFSLGQYAVAEPAYLSLVRPDHANAFPRAIAMYMLGWSRFKQGQFDTA